MTPFPPVAYKVLTLRQQQELLDVGAFEGSPADLADGFIHLSTSEQLAGTLDKHYAGQTGLFIAAVDLSVLGESVRWEAARGGKLFPHIYGSLPLRAVVTMSPLERLADGSVRLPQSG